MFWDYSSWKEIERVRRDVEKALKSRCSEIEGHKYPPINLYESKDNVIVTAEMPGVSRDSVTITLTNDIIIVSDQTVNNQQYKTKQTKKVIDKKKTYSPTIGNLSTHV